MKRLLIILADLVTVAVVLWVWQGVSKREALNVSRPSDVVSALGLWVTQPTLRSDIYTTLEEAAIGLVLAVACAVVLAVIVGSSKQMADFCGPFVSIANAIPKIALAPLFLLLFGIGFASKVYFILAGVVFIPFYSLFRALTTMDPVYVDNAKSLGARRGWLVWDVYIPAMVGSMVASLRVATAFAITGAIVAELISSQEGIGYEIAQAQSDLQPALLVSGVLVAAILAFVLDTLMQILERRFDSWRVAS